METDHQKPKKRWIVKTLRRVKGPAVLVCFGDRGGRLCQSRLSPTKGSVGWTDSTIYAAHLWFRDPAPASHPGLMEGELGKFISRLPLFMTRVACWREEWTSDSNM